MTPAEMREVGLRLYGPAWKRHIAAALGRHHVTIYKWMELEQLPKHAAAAVRLLEHNQPGRKEQ